MNSPLEEIVETIIKKIIRRMPPDGGFSLKDNGRSRPDATAWAAIALTSINGENEYSTKACKYLTKNQLEDGRISLVDELPEACWPTFLAILAWNKATGFSNNSNKAISFLLKYTGKHWTKTAKQEKIFGHDTKLRGWPWIENTHSWVEPTSLAILALKSKGYGQHERVLEGVKMILDRQLPSGGWNYGNTTVFNQKLLPMPDSTGLALLALKGSVEKMQIQNSLTYMVDELQNLRTPQSLSWALFGLSAWSIDVMDFRKMIIESLSFQRKFGDYDTCQLSQLLLACTLKANLLEYIYQE